MSKRYCFALDLKDNEDLIKEYEHLHQKIPSAIRKSITDSGIIDMEIYRVANRLFMIMETDDKFSFEKKSGMDILNTEVQAWENLMWKYQQSLPFAKPGEKWVSMNKIFDLNNNVQP